MNARYVVLEYGIYYDCYTMPYEDDTLQNTLFTHVGGWIHHQATLYGHASILCVVYCDRVVAKLITSYRG